MNTKTVRASADRHSSTIRVRRITLLVVLSVALCWLGYSIVRPVPGADETAEAAQDGGVYLLREPVERAGYFNEWWAYPGERDETETEIEKLVPGPAIENIWAWSRSR